MKYSLRYNNRSIYKNTVEELVIQYKEKNLNLIEFAAARPEKQRLVVDVPATEMSEDNIEIFVQAAAAHPNFAIRLDSPQFYLVEPLQQKNIPYFFKYYCTTEDDIVGMVKMGVSDIYICNSLGFNIIKLSAYCYKHNVNVRVIPNVAQTSSWWAKEIIDPEDTLTYFFVRPEDVNRYEDYVDYMEIYGPIEDQDYCYEIYREQKWLGKLNQIIIGYEGEAYNRELSEMFGLHRTTCQKKCNLNGCSICHQFKDLSIKLFNNGKTLKYHEPLLTKEEYAEKIKSLIKRKEQTEDEYKIDEADLYYGSELVKREID